MLEVALQVDLLLLTLFSYFRVFALQAQSLSSAIISDWIHTLFFILYVHRTKALALFLRSPVIIIIIILLLRDLHRYQAARGVLWITRRWLAFHFHRRLHIESALYNTSGHTVFFFLLLLRRTHNIHRNTHTHTSITPFSLSGAVFFFIVLFFFCILLLNDVFLLLLVVFVDCDSTGAVCGPHAAGQRALHDVHAC